MCPDEAFLSAYLDNEVAPARRHSLDQHLHGCPVCRARLHSLALVNQACRSAQIDVADGDGHSLPDFFLDREVRRSQMRRMSRPRLVDVGKAVLPLAASAVLALGGFLFFDALDSEAVSAVTPIQPLTVVASYSLPATQVADYHQRLQTLDAHFEMTLPDGLPLPALAEEDVYVGEQFAQR